MGEGKNGGKGGEGIAGRWSSSKTSREKSYDQGAKIKKGTATAKIEACSWRKGGRKKEGTKLAEFIWDHEELINGGN